MIPRNGEDGSAARFAILRIGIQDRVGVFGVTGFANVQWGWRRWSAMYRPGRGDLLGQGGAKSSRTGLSPSNQPRLLLRMRWRKEGISQRVAHATTDERCPSYTRGRRTI